MYVMPYTAPKSFNSSQAYITDFFATNSKASQKFTHSKTVKESYPKHGALKIGCVNIGGNIKDRIVHINTKLLGSSEHSYDILALVETHTYASDITWLSASFPHYHVFSAGTTKQIAYGMYIKNKYALIDSLGLSAQQTAILKDQVNEYRAPNYGGIIVLVKKTLKNYFTQVDLIPDNRGVTLTVQTMYTSSPYILIQRSFQYIHMVYMQCNMVKVIKP